MSRRFEPAEHGVATPPQDARAFKDERLEEIGFGAGENNGSIVEAGGSTPTTLWTGR